MNSIAGMHQVGLQAGQDGLCIATLHYLRDRVTRGVVVVWRVRLRAGLLVWLVALGVGLARRRRGVALTLSTSLTSLMPRVIRRLPSSVASDVARVVRFGAGALRVRFTGCSSSNWAFEALRVERGFSVTNDPGIAGSSSVSAVDSTVDARVLRLVFGVALGSGFCATAVVRRARRAFFGVGAGAGASSGIGASEGARNNVEVSSVRSGEPSSVGGSDRRRVDLLTGGESSTTIGFGLRGVARLLDATGGLKGLEIDGGGD